MQGTENRQQTFLNKNGVTYFTKRTERRILFVLTLAMLAWGAAEFMHKVF
ncbi:hypothetical protein [Salidesulfovibrio onnuriiensis]|nr:hypothetical protein [Salidesulfovibrio onnuriiensis]